MLWKLWAKALGDKAGKTDKDSARIAYIRTTFVVLTIITELHIIANVWLNHYWGV